MRKPKTGIHRTSFGDFSITSEIRTLMVLKSGEPVDRFPLFTRFYISQVVFSPKAFCKNVWSPVLGGVVVSNMFLFSSLFGEDEPNFTNMFQMGWNQSPIWNHSLLGLLLHLGRDHNRRVVFRDVSSCLVSSLQKRLLSPWQGRRLCCFQCYKFF